MKKKFLLVLLSLFLFISCSKNDDLGVYQNSNVKEYFYGYMDYPISLNSTGEKMIKIDFDLQGKIKKRIGGGFYYYANSGVGSGISYKYYEDLYYVGSKILIVEKVNSESESPIILEKEVLLDNKNRMVKKIIPYTDYAYGKTYTYTYNNKDLIVESIEKQTYQYENPEYEYHSKYYYNNKQNLDSIVTIKKYPFQGALYNIWKDVEVFSGFDNSTNQLKKFIIFKETFHRALSHNNYTKYKKYHYDFVEPIEDENTEEGYYVFENVEEKSWDFYYDIFDNILYLPF